MQTLENNHRALPIRVDQLYHTGVTSEFTHARWVTWSWTKRLIFVSIWEQPLIVPEYKPMKLPKQNMLGMKACSQMSLKENINLEIPFSPSFHDFVWKQMPREGRTENTAKEKVPSPPQLPPGPPSLRLKDSSTEKNEFHDLCKVWAFCYGN